jgi:hypothetical protein
MQGVIAKHNKEFINNLTDNDMKKYKAQAFKSNKLSRICCMSNCLHYNLLPANIR